MRTAAGLNAAMSTRTDTRLLSNYIGGHWVASTASDELDVTNPATGEILARVPLSGAADVDAAVQAARAAFPELAPPPDHRARPLAVRLPPGRRGSRRRARPLRHP